MLQGIIVGASGTLHDPRDGKQWTGDCAADKKLLRLHVARVVKYPKMRSCPHSLSLTANPRLPPNTSLQLLLEAGARDERTLEAVSCKALLDNRSFPLTVPSSFPMPCAFLQFPVLWFLQEL
jgi:hypothetical protein